VSDLYAGQPFRERTTTTDTVCKPDARHTGGESAEECPRCLATRNGTPLRCASLRPLSLLAPHFPPTTANGSHKTLNMHEKWSTEILKELMEVAGGDSWSRWKSEAASGGLPLVPGEENENQVVKRSPVQLPSLKDFLASRPPTPAPGSEPSTKDAEVTSGALLGTNQLKVPIPPQVPKTSVSAAIP
jgi:hypothetical protein